MDMPRDSPSGRQLVGIRHNSAIGQRFDGAAVQLADGRRKRFDSGAGIVRM